MEYQLLLQRVSRKRPRKQVTFLDQPDAEIGNRSVTTEEELQALWYHKAELAHFKLDARDYVLGINTMQQETRGFERYDMERVQNKALAIKCTLLAVQQGLGPEEIGAIAQKCSSWAQNEAFKIGLNDYCQVYHPTALLVQSPPLPATTSLLPNALIDCPVNPLATPITTTSIGNKRSMERSVTGGEELQRRVRLRKF